MTVPAQIKIYHIVHIDRLPSIIKDNCLWCDRLAPPGKIIGMNKIKERRLNELTLASHPGLYVGDCAPFYFCPRSVMLFLIYRANHNELAYRDGQGPIIHLEADLRASVAWAQKNNRRWAFTLSNAGAYYFEDRSNLAQLNEINWNAVHATDWRANVVKESKQAEFLMEYSFPWHLVERIGVHSPGIYRQANNALAASEHRPPVEIKPEWYY